MGGRGVVGSRVSAGTRTRWTLRRLVLVGAFCLVGWVVLAVGDASSAAASERSTTDRKLGGDAHDAARGAVGQVISDAKTLRPGRQQTAGRAAKPTAGRDMTKKVAGTADELTERLNHARHEELPGAAGSGWTPGWLPHTPAPQSPDTPGQGGSGGDASAALPVPAAEMPADEPAAGSSVRDLLYVRPADGAEAPVLPLRAAPTGQHPNEWPGWPAADQPVSPPVGSSTGWSAGTGNAPPTLASMPTPVSGSDPPRATAACADEPVPSNDAVEPPVSPD